MLGCSFFAIRSWIKKRKRDISTRLAEAALRAQMGVERPSPTFLYDPPIPMVIKSLILKIRMYLQISLNSARRENMEHSLAVKDPIPLNPPPILVCKFIYRY